MKIDTKTKKLTLCAVMIALATVLSLIQIYPAPYGGTITPGSMVPIIILCIRDKNMKWSLLACFAYSLIQMMLGFAAPPTKTLLYFFLVVFLDYLIAFTILWISGPVARSIPNKCVGVGVGVFVAVFCRFICHFLSGILIWGAYAPEGMKVWIYSLIYNGGYMLPELIITIVLSVAIYIIIEKRKS